MNFIFPYIGNVIIPTDEVIFFRGVGQPPSSINFQQHEPHWIDPNCWVFRFGVIFWADLQPSVIFSGKKTRGNGTSPIYIHLHILIFYKNLHLPVYSIKKSTKISIYRAFFCGCPAAYFHQSTGALVQTYMQHLCSNENMKSFMDARALGSSFLWVGIVDGFLRFLHLA